jgi:hypothetical protein
LSRVRSSSILAARIFPEERGDHVSQRSARPIVLERDADERAAVGPGLEAHGAERLLLTCWRARTAGGRCGIGSWGGRRLRMGDYVTATTRAAARCRRVLMLPILLRCVAAKGKVPNAKCKLTMRPVSSFAQRRE